MRWLSFLCAASLFGQTFEATPRRVRQGETITVRASPEVESARLNERTIQLFPQTAADTGEAYSLGLMPVAIGQKPGSYRLDFLAKDGTSLHTEDVIVLDAHYPKQNVVLSKSVAALKSSSDERETVETFRREVSPVRYWTLPLEPPLPGCMTSLFGVERYINGKPTGDFHGGIDQRGAAQTPIRAIAAGVVKVTGKYDLRGGTVGMDHGQGLESIYLHMSQVLAKNGDHVAKGDVIGLVGSTGRSTAPHLHWTLYVQGEPVNPLQWMKLKPCAAKAPNRPARRHPST